MMEGVRPGKILWTCGSSGPQDCILQAATSLRTWPSSPTSRLLWALKSDKSVYKSYFCNLLLLYPCKIPTLSEAQFLQLNLPVLRINGILCAKQVAWHR